MSDHFGPRRRQRRRHCAIAATTVVAVGVLAPSDAGAKLAGRIHCYRSVCHRVLSIEETRRLIGSTRLLLASAYDSPTVDRFNKNLFTSNGERFDAGDADRVAAADLPDGTLLLLRNPDNGRTSHVLVNDFGPFYRSRTIDATRRVAEDLGFSRKGVTPLEVTVLATPKPGDIGYKKGRRLSGAMGYIGEFAAEDVGGLISGLVEAQSRMLASDDGGAPITESAPARSAGSASPGAVTADHVLPVREAAASPDIESPIRLAALDTHGARQVDQPDGPAFPPSPDGGAVASPETAGEPPYPVRSSEASELLTMEALALTGADLPAEGLPVATSTTLAEAVAPDDGQAALPVADLLGEAIAEPVEDDRETIATGEPVRVAGAGDMGSAGFSTTFAGAGWQKVREPAGLERLATAARDLLLGPAGLRTSSSGPASLLAMAGTMTTLLLYMLYGTRVPRPFRRRRSRADQANATARIGTDEYSPIRHGWLQRSARALSNEPPQASRPATPAPALAAEAPSLASTYLGPDLWIAGNIRSQGFVRVAGHVEGRIEAATIVIERSGTVDGDIAAGTVVVEGHLKGRVSAGRFVAMRGASVEADISAGSMAVDAGAMVEAQIRCKLIKELVSPVGIEPTTT